MRPEQDFDRSRGRGIPPLGPQKWENATHHQPGRHGRTGWPNVIFQRGTNNRRSALPASR